MNTKSERKIPSAEAARRLSHLLFGQDIGVVMATTATWGGKDISRNPTEPARIHGEDRDCWIGEWMEGFGLCDVRFAKSGCREMTEAEVAKLEGCTRGVVSPLEAAATHRPVLA